MIKFTPETHKKFIEDPDYASQVLLDVGARVITEFWRNAMDILLQEMALNLERIMIVSKIRQTHSDFTPDPVFWQLASEVKADSPNGKFEEQLEETYKRWQVAKTNLEQNPQAQ